MSSSDDTSSAEKLEFHECRNLEWQPITLTFVEYPKGDIIGHFLAWVSLAPIAIGVGFVTLILFRRDLHTISFFLGTLINEITNLILKYWIKEPRPMDRLNIYTEYGMPSSHSQFIWFFSTYVTLFVVIRLHHMNNNAPLERAARFLVLLTSWILTALVCISRIYLRYHSWAQVIVGSIVGMLTGGSWFCLIHIVLSPMFPHIVSWKISEFLLLRDMTLIPNILWFEYTVTRQESRARARKLISMKSQ
uniref:Dolichyldiphosphatase n=1 Tax=Tabanus bromius TaxID=304241 RepID=A0A0K8TNR3_TABBR